MQKNQKYSKEEMYLAIEMWHESKLSQREFCQEENLSVKTFAYWLKKYKSEKGVLKEELNAEDTTFIPVEVTKEQPALIPEPSCIEILYPNGVKMKCPLAMNVALLKTLISI